MVETITKMHACNQVHALPFKRSRGHRKDLQARTSFFLPFPITTFSSSSLRRYTHTCTHSHIRTHGRTLLLVFFIPSQAMAKVELWCDVEDDPRPFLVDVAYDSYIYRIQEQVVAVKDESLQRVNVSNLILWRVSVPFSEDGNLILLKTVLDTDKKELSPTTRLRHNLRIHEDSPR